MSNSPAPLHAPCATLSLPPSLSLSLPPPPSPSPPSDLVAAAVLSGNRNFEGRVHPLTRANYLASPPLVVAYALAGRVGRMPRTRGREGEE